VALLHYSAPPVIGGVEAVMLAHARLLLNAGYHVGVIAGRGAADALPPGIEFHLVPEIDSQHPVITQLSMVLEQGRIPTDFNDQVARLMDVLSPIVSHYDHVLVHNVFTKHFNLPLTAALHELLDRARFPHTVAWCHDFTWTSDHSRSKVHPGYPWDLLRTRRTDVAYVTVSQRRQLALAKLFHCDPGQIQVAYNGVNAEVLWGLSAEGRQLAERLQILDSDLILLMPVRVTQAKNIELALRVVAVLKSRGCRVRLIVTGPPDPHDTASMAYFRSLKQLQRELAVTHEARFVFESGPNPQQPYMIDEQLVAELYRLSDAMFMPSHREGFGMPILEAGLMGLPVICTDVPAAEEIGGEDVLWFKANDTAETVAELILAWTERSQEHQLRRRVRQNYTWAAIFEHDIAPLLKEPQPIR
jgi:glycosyltransferase involved in cell wall biosynthesis